MDQTYDTKSISNIMIQTTFTKEDPFIMIQITFTKEEPFIIIQIAFTKKELFCSNSIIFSMCKKKCIFNIVYTVKTSFTFNPSEACFSSIIFNSSLRAFGLVQLRVLVVTSLLENNDTLVII
jgi:hypothetical protein